MGGMARFVVSMLAVALALVACGGQTERDRVMEKRLHALERKVDQLKERTRALERHQDQLAEQGEELGANQSDILRRQGKLEGKLERLDSELVRKRGDEDHKRPQADVVYSVPLHDSPILGPKVAKVTLVATLDFTETHSRALWPTLTRLHEAFGDDLKIVFKPFIVHPDAGVIPARAACAGVAQGKYGDIAELMFEQLDGAKDWSEDHVRDLVGQLQIDLTKWDAAFKGAACKAAIERDQKLFETLGQYAVPASWINGRFVSGAQSFDKLKRIIEDEVTKADTYVDRRGAKLERYYPDIVKSGAKAP